MRLTLAAATTGVTLLGATVTAPIASADSLGGGSCSDWMKISADSATGNRVFCAQARPGDPDSPLVWTAWDSPYASAWGSLLLVGPVASLCAAAEYTFGRSTDSYV